ncbi:hypothetical protein ACJJTC_015325 [Scirpophaga incertulas]
MYRTARYLTPYARTSSVRRSNSGSTDTNNSTPNITNMPHPRELPVFGTKLSLLASGNGSKLHEYIDKRHKQLGPIFYEKLEGNTKLVFISDPYLIKTLFLKLEGKYPAHILPEPWILYEHVYGSKRGLFFMNGEDWLANRRILNAHVLRDDSDKWLEGPITATIDKFIQNWKIKAKSGHFVPDIESELYRLSIDVIINVLQGTECITPGIFYEELLTMFSESVKKIFHTTTQLYGLPVSWYYKLNLKPWREFKECVDLSILLGNKIVSEILSRSDKSDGLIAKLRKENMSKEVITKIVTDFVIAAGDTTAYTTLWTFILLSRNNLESEELLNQGKTYAKYIIKEAMRLYPVAPFLTRILPKESILGKYTLGKGTPVIASIYTSGRDENNFSRANDFAPYRWDRNNPRKKEIINHVPSASLPFAMGARSCIGKKIAMLQIAEVIYQVNKNFEYSCKNCEGLSPITSQVLIPNKNIKFIFSLRQKYKGQIEDLSLNKY